MRASTRDTPATASRRDRSGPRYSVVVPVKNSVAWLQDLGEVLASQQPPAGGFEVIWVDDQSTDGSYELLSRICESDPRSHLIRGPGLGPAAARNAGIGVAAGEYIAFADSDTVPNHDWLAQAANAIQRRGLRALEGSISPWTDENGPLVRNVRNQDGGRYMTANMVYEKALLEEVGCFDETFRMPHFLEDTDLAFRVLDKGVDIPFVPEAGIRHREIRVRPVYLLKELRKLKWVAFLARKHPQRYETELRPKLQTFRPGDFDLLLAAPLALASRRANLPARVLSLLLLVLAARRVVLSADFEGVAPADRPAFVAAVLATPAVRLACLAHGWVRFRKLVL